MPSSYRRQRRKETIQRAEAKARAEEEGKASVLPDFTKDAGSQPGQQQWESFYIGGDDTCEAQTQTDENSEEEWMRGVLQQMMQAEDEMEEEEDNLGSAEGEDPRLTPELLEEIQYYNELTQDEIKLLIEQDYDYASDSEHEESHQVDFISTFSFELMD